ncbi:hypothetical protein P744_0106465 [Enterococcus faecium UC10237]|uniref:hypothetical protein n=1 Tax=Enterococcus TaxID=1350 RepID=UPI0002A313BF|nr:MULTISPECIES: hypothetical protein [Enterococcus]ELB12734.1 hypothetical protein OIM_03350 [Enterococcus faecium EnGen0032]EOH44271.1 hypothetical protein SSI_02389 [Enterococcus faecium EnGen0191]KEI57687.1 hypothetical protein P744_0106465 [Enterococcus faecium UC10237]AWX47331.1 hypothetical protein DPR13_05140 [Enterococcus faecium]EGP5034341.1 hypothetical protein [Enterococcus faecium]
MPQESNAKNKQIESLDHLIEGINKLKTDVLDGTVIIESTYASRETNHQVLATPRLACESLRVEIELRRSKGK